VGGDRDGAARARIGELAKVFAEEAEPAPLSAYAIEDWATFAAFWGLVSCLILQFFTRYVLNDSLAWTEEVASNGLVVVVFLGAVMCVRRARHIRVDIVHRLIAPRARRVLQLAVELFAIAFFAYMAWLVWRYAGLMGHDRMITVDLPRGWVFQAVLAAFVLMCLRAVQRLAVHRARDESDAQG
jgi:TRAP-type C4-dicarboxylate transport system permease small subunit